MRYVFTHTHTHTHGRKNLERRQGAGLTLLPPGRSPEGGLRRSDEGQMLSDLSGGDL